MINWKARIKNKTFILQLLGALILPMLAYQGLNPEDLTSWKALADLFIGTFTNPYLLGVTVWSVFNAVTDPTTAGISDSDQAMSYDKPKEK